MTRVNSIRALGATLLLMAVTAVQAQTATPAEKAIEYRQAVFKVVAGNFGPLAQSAQGKVELPPAAARQYAERLSEISQFARDAFPDISREGKTRAKPEIWSERAEFDKLLKDLTDATKSLRASRPTRRPNRRNSRPPWERWATPARVATTGSAKSDQWRGRQWVATPRASVAAR
jgi:cytochrome c556